MSGSLAAGSGFGAPVQGRLVDRIGARRVLVPLACVHALALGAIVGFAELGAPTGVLLLCGFIAGFAVPPTSSVLRSMWTDLLEPRLHQAAYALDSTMIEVIFISGPLLTAGIAAVTSPAGALIVSAVAVVDRHDDLHRAAADPARRARASTQRERAARRAGVPGRAHARADLAARPGSALGILEVGIPAFSRAEGAAAGRGRAARAVVVRELDRRPAVRDPAAPARACSART